jgi:hypothetical protein
MTSIDLKNNPSVRFTYNVTFLPNIPQENRPPALENLCARLISHFNAPPNHIFLKLEVSGQGLKGETTQEGFNDLKNWDGNMSNFANQFSSKFPEKPANRVFDTIKLQLVEEITMEYLLRRIEALEKENAEQRAEIVQLREELTRYRTLYGPLPPQ